MIFVLLTLALIDLSSAQIIQSGQCDQNIELAGNFDVTEFLGTWHVVSRTNSPLTNGDCSHFEFTEQNGVISVYKRSLKNNFLEETSGTVTLEVGTPKLSLTTTATSEPTDFWILVTDSEHYALAYACENLGTTQRSVTIWQLGRQTTLEFELMEVVMEVALNTRLGISLEDLTGLDHSELACSELPLIPEGEPIILSGQCDPNIPVVQNFEVDRFTGVWREISSYYTPNAVGTCPRAEYTLSGNVVNVLNSQVIEQSLDTISGTASVSSDDGSARLTVRLEVQPGNFVESQLWILATDYTNYAVSYVCVDLPNNQKQVTSWILSRARELTDADQVAVNQVINSQLDLNSQFYIAADQSDEGCFYFPEHVPGQPVTFRGQCDMNIPAMPDFNAELYMGLWHDIESYPSEFQGGTCNNAEYTLVQGEQGAEVDVFNTQVIDQRLDTIRGVARVATEDGSAKLVVTFPIAGTDATVTTDYWVLRTDYTSYALVYTCVNLNPDERRVWSWKLSRTKQLQQSAIVEINDAMSAVDVLQHEYFEDRNQSEEGCFYFPEPQPDKPVVFPGNCDNSIPVVENFNMAQFEGYWYEIEAYPKEDQTGQCVHHSFLVSGNTMNLQSSSVTDQQLITSSSSVSSTDGSGRLLITISIGTEVIEIPYWILSTDYTSYALAYSCVDLNEDFRAVYSWKLSRTQQLTDAANIDINNVIANTIVLGDEYYQDIDQSERACFALPDIPDGEPFILDGQCDENIEGIPNFEASRYLGRWRLIESYVSDFQTGTCNDATYSPSDDGVTVVNTQVVNQQLDSIVGSAVLSSTDNSGKLLVTFPGAPEPVEYVILDTDYDTYSLVYSCSNIDTQRRRIWSWKMSKTRDLSATANENMNRVIDSIDVLNNRFYETMDHSDNGCFYYPEPGASVPVTFRGQCDQNIPVVTGFSAFDYTGIWYDVASYPSLFQDGTCNTAEYTLAGETVDVFNTQVVNETLDTIRGVARLAGTDGQAKLIVTFPIVGTPLTVDSDYWVLATDYSTYALVYTCLNLDDERRQVWSWKLSRTTQLTTEASNDIDEVISTIPVLDNQYYEDKDHSDDGCFYFPDPEPGVPVVFPGQCDTNIQAVADFNMASFIGTWNEIEAYPKEFQPGECVTHEYSAGTGDTLNLVSSGISNETLETTSSVLRFASAQDTSGKLEIVTISNNIETVVPFWILSTDYQRYALAYSCVNIGDRSRAVYSWKLSRNKELSAIDNALISNAMTNIPVLDARYFEEIQQTDDACFYLPEHVPGQTVVFPGQCDNNINVVQNFEPTRYEGRWRMIESYPSEFQGGECGDATYTLTPENTVDVYNTQVVNQELDTIHGTAVLATTDGSGKLLVTFPGAPEPSEYWILATDYDHFALVYSCRNINSEQRRVWSWKLSRSATLSTEASAAIDQIVDEVNVLNDRFYDEIDQSDDACFYYPTPDGRPVRFRGQCDENIPVVTDFDVEAYMGSWYDLESYPVAFQDGTCPTATYTLDADGVLVYNTQVVAQEQDSIYGRAVPTYTDGSAKLTVSFPIAGTDLITESPYWVLATDYTNYALVYSCVNIDDEYRRVSSWKLSRQWNLTEESENEINQAMASVPVLRQDYYLERGHDPDACFFYPDNEGGPVLLSGACDINDVDIVSDFDLNAFQGTWHEAERFPSELQTGECVAQEFEPTGTNTFQVTKTIVHDERTTVVSGPATVAADNRGIIELNLSDGAGATFATTMYVVDVVYDDFVLLYGCRDAENDKKQIYSWKLSRSQGGLSDAATARIDEIVDSTVDLFQGYYEETDQTLNGCFFYPEYEDDSPRELIGPCDESIRGKANFDVNRYLGKWYEIAAYPQVFQNGECARATYSAGDNNVVNVLNTQVVNRTLDVMAATAVVASTDGSGLLSVTFDLGGGVLNTVNYYVLETDYDNFALVYSCRNLGNDWRQVTSWKLSKDTTLSAQAEAIMAPIIESTQGLLQDYYQPTSQTEDDCFYIPEVDKNEAPRFRGQCEEITGVQGFNAQQYLGWWHEIERYPVDTDVGQCISTDIRAAGNQFQVIDTSVSNLVAVSATGTVAITNDGKLTKTFSNGQVEEMWVLATDYNTYSLLYSCENIDSQYMKVWSAKHSQSRHLTESAIEAMEPVIAANRVLEPQFYQQVDQDDEACFHYPDQSGQQIILPGNCDENIPVQQQFNPEMYTGTWYQTERYPQIHESGTCTGARYTLDIDTGVVNVVNWQVIDGVLDTIEGTATVNSTDGSAKLIVTLPVRGTDDENPGTVAMWLYVLETNYLSYSVAYSCVNIDDFHRAVGVWKLSRTRTMLDADQATINALVSRRPELYQPYFIPVEQNDECEEPSSATAFYQSVVVILICIFVHGL